MARNHDQPPQTQPHFASEHESLGRFNERLMALRNQVVRDKASQAILMKEIGDLKARGAADLIASLQKEIDFIDRRITRFESEIMGLETRLFGK